MKFFNQFFYSSAIAILLTLYSPFSLAQQMYIDDTLFVPLRSGEGTSFRIVHKGLKSGTRVEVISENKDKGYSKVRTSGGKEGFLPTRYLVSKPIARAQLAEITRKFESLQREKTQSDEALASLETEHATLQEKLAALQSQSAATETELSSIKSISANALQLDSQNRELNETNEKLMGELELIKTENARLKDNRESDMLIYGGILVVLGVVLALVIPALKPSKKAENWV